MNVEQFISKYEQTDCDYQFCPKTRRYYTYTQQMCFECGCSTGITVDLFDDDRLFGKFCWHCALKISGQLFLSNHGEMLCRMIIITNPEKYNQLVKKIQNDKRNNNEDFIF